MTLYLQDLERIKKEITERVRERNPIIERACFVWAEEGVKALNEFTNSNDFIMVHGSLRVCVNQTNKNDITEGWYWGYCADQADSQYDEFHIWIENRKQKYLIDFSTEFLEHNFNIAKNHPEFEKSIDFMDYPNYKWNRFTPIPNLLYVRNFTYNKITNQFGLEYKPEIGHLPSYDELSPIDKAIIQNM